MDTQRVEVMGRERRLTKHDSSWKSSQFTREYSPKELQILIAKGFVSMRVPVRKGGTIKRFGRGIGEPQGIIIAEWLCIRPRRREE